MPRKVSTTTGTPASRAASWPSSSAFGVWQWTIVNRSLRMMRYSRQSVIRSAIGVIDRVNRTGMCRMPRSSSARTWLPAEDNAVIS